MTIDNYLLYLFVAAGFIASPGPAVFLAINGGVCDGVKTTAITLLGNSIGLGVLALISAVGVGAVVVASPEFLVMLKITGALWLAYLGVRMLLANAPSVEIKCAPTSQRGHHFAIRIIDGFVLAITNPKPIIFFLSIYPQFIIASGYQARQFLLLAITFMLMSFTLLCGYALFSSCTIGKILNGRRMQIFNRLFGLIFISLGVFLLVAML